MTGGTRRSGAPFSLVPGRVAAEVREADRCFVLERRLLRALGRVCTRRLTVVQCTVVPACVRVTASRRTRSGAVVRAALGRSVGSCRFGPSGLAASGRSVGARAARGHCACTRKLRGRGRARSGAGHAGASSANARCDARRPCPSRRRPVPGVSVAPVPPPCGCPAGVPVPPPTCARRVRSACAACITAAAGAGRRRRRPRLVDPGDERVRTGRELQRIAQERAVAAGHAAAPAVVARFGEWVTPVIQASPPASVTPRAMSCERPPCNVP